MKQQALSSFAVKAPSQEKNRVSASVRGEFKMTKTQNISVAMALQSPTAQHGNFLYWSALLAEKFLTTNSLKLFLR